MPFPVLGSNSAVAGFEIDNSLRFNDGDSPSLAKTFSADGSATQFCISVWVKRARVSGAQQLLFSANTDGSNYGTIKFSGDNKIQINLINSGSDQDEIVTDAVYRDPSAWYHLFFRFDKTQASLTDGIKLYVNNVLQTWGTTTYAQNQGYHFGKNGTPMYIGNFNGAESYADLYFSEVYYVEGELKNPTDFGEVNDNGVWIPKEYEGNFGDEGFKLEFQDSGNLGDDTSGNGNDFTSTNLTATDQTTDTPTNNFCTLNPLDQSNSYAQNDATRGTFSEGNCNFSSAGQIGGAERYYNTTGTIAIPSSGKWYWEAKPNNGTNGLGFRWTMGFLASNHEWSNAGFVEWTESQGQRGAYRADGTVWYNNSQISSGHGTVSVNDIISFKYDADNRDFFVAVNGTYINSGNAVLTSSNITATDFLLIFLQNGSDGDVATAMNFGNAPFTISSGNSDANGYGNFEYAVPSGYYSLCTKNLAEYG